MNKQKPVILAIDDEADMLKTYESILKKNYQVITSESGKVGLGKLKTNSIDLVILDIRMPKMDGIEVLRTIKKEFPGTEVIMATGSKDVVSAVEAMKLGAFDYITKPFDVDELLIVIEKALEKNNLVRENIYLKETLSKSESWCGDIIGKSPQIEKIKELIKSIAKTDSTVLISGESGSGKEVVARAIHGLSSRKNMPFVAINCAAIPENLLESELFGFERGAFTGATERRIGKFEMADGGTLFLDEIGCMSQSMQSKLLRVLQERQFERLGGNIKVSVDVRIISATNIDFEKSIKEGKFREDLYYRLNVIPINMPALRERKSDLLLFITFFINKFNKEFNKKIKTVSPAVSQKLQDYDFPGNVRELQNLIERAVALAKGTTIEEENIFGLRASIESGANEEQRALKDSSALKDSVEEFERMKITQALKDAGWNQTKAAIKLGIARTTLSSRMLALGIRE